MLANRSVCLASSHIKPLRSFTHPWRGWLGSPRQSWKDHWPFFLRSLYWNGWSKCVASFIWENYVFGDMRETSNAGAKIIKFHVRAKFERTSPKTSNFQQKFIKLQSSTQFQTIERSAGWSNSEWLLVFRRQVKRTSNQFGTEIQEITRFSNRHKKIGNVKGTWQCQSTPNSSY